MPSTTATQLASNRRKLRLAQHNRAHSATTPAVVGGRTSSASPVLSTPPVATNPKNKKDVSPTPSPTETTNSGSTNTAPSSPKSEGSVSSSLSGAARRRLLLRREATEHASNVSSQHHQRSRSLGNRPQHLQADNAGSDVGGSSVGGGRYANNVTTSRGRSRRSRAATGRGSGLGVSSQGARAGGASSDRMEEEEDVLSSEVDTDNHGGTSGSGGGGAQQIMNHGDEQTSPRRRTQQQQHRHGGHHKLNLHVAGSVDSDDNGTCFNSIGTTTPRQPSPRHSVRKEQHQQQGSRDPPASPSLEISPGNATIDSTSSSRQRLLKKNARSRRTRMANNGNNNGNNMILSHSDTLSPLQENTTLSPRSRNKGIGTNYNSLVRGPPELQQPELLGENQNKPVVLAPSPSSRMMNSSVNNNSQGNNNNAGGRTGQHSIWDHPEEMINNNNANSRPSNNSAAKNNTTANGSTTGGGSIAYSEFDQDGGGSRAGTSSSYQPSGYGYARRGRSNGNSMHQGGGASMESASRYDQGYNNNNNSSSIILERDALFNAMGTIGGEPFGSSGENASFRRGGGSIVSNNNSGDAMNANGDGSDDLLNRPNMKTALGVGAAATLGAIVLGPVGLLVGAASIGIGMGVMQIPEEQRNNVRNHATTSLERARDIACDLSDHMSTNCAKYTGTDPHEVVSRVVPEEIMDSCGCTNVGRSHGGDGDDDQANYFRNGGAGGGGGIGGVAGMDDGHSLAGTEGPFGGPVGLEIRSEGSSPIANAVNGVERGVNRLVGDVFGDGLDPQHHHHHSSPASQSMLTAGPGVVAEKGGRSVGGGNAVDHHHHAGGGGLGVVENEDQGRRVACGRKGRVVPLSQIHSLRPSLQPRAWLDVMASAHTTRDDKNEAMQEILILAKDKDISRWFLEEGILDSLMFILSNYFRNYSSFLRSETQVVMCEEMEEPFSSFKQGGNAFYHAKLAANCCVALGKAHCAAVHTEGDLLLMSAYSRGSVPVQRQLAQMLFEVPHHMKVMNPSAAGSGNNINDNQQQQFDAEFTLTELSMQQAEDLASSIKALDDGKIDV